MREAVEDHRASSDHEPRSIYGKIVAEADRIIDTDTTLRRTVQYGLKQKPAADEAWHYQRFHKHLMEKYAPGGYLKLWLPDSKNAERLKELQSIIADEVRLKSIFHRMFEGKSTLFNCLSSAKAQAANFPFCTIDAQMGQVSVPDERLTKLAEIVHPGRIVPAVCDIVDIAGLVKGASKGEGLGNQFLGNIRECDAIIHVLRCFDNGNIVHVDGSVDPVRDKEIIDTELQLKDLDTVENRIKRVEKIAKVGGDKMAKVEYELLLRYKDALEQGQSARTVIPQNDDEEQCAKQMFLLTTKPVLYVCNVDDTSAATGNQYVEQVREAIKDEDAQLIIISAQTEADIAELETYEEKQMFLEDLGLKESGCNRLIKAIYSLLNLETFITAGEMEVKAWTYRKGWKAPQCAGVIHTDFEKGFIRAEVIKYEDYIKYGSEAAVREAGKLGVEGKEYVVQDGDIMHFRFNV